MRSHAGALWTFVITEVWLEVEKKRKGACPALAELGTVC